MLEIMLMLLLVLSATALLLGLPARAKNWKLELHGLEFINSQGKYQLLALALGLCLCLLLWLLFPQQFIRFFAFGNLAASTNGMALFAIGAGESWLGLGLSFSVFITAATAFFMYMSFRQFAA